MATYSGTFCAFIALDAVRPSISCRLMPASAHSKSDSTCSGKGSGENSRSDCRPDSADIKGMPPLSDGGSSTRNGVASPTGGKSLCWPMRPRASLVRAFKGSPVHRAGPCRGPRARKL